MERRFGPIVFIPGENSGKYPYCHSLYVEADRKVIVDPSSDRKRLSELLQGPGVDVAWLSHWHEDHLMHLDLFDDRELWVSEPDAAPITDLEAFCDAYGMDSKEREFWRPVMLEQFNFKPRTADRLIQEEGPIDLGGVVVEVMFTPGHTPGHCSLYFPEQKVLFLGDYDLTPFGPWYGDAFSDIDIMIDSVNRLRTVPARVWIASHETGMFDEEPGELWDNFLGVIDRREETLLDYLKEPRTMQQIGEAGLVYGPNKKPKEFFEFGERRLMGKHLERLIKRGAVVQDGDRYHLTTD
jgi:hydroxyacylglutathione hydrolase